MTKAIDSAQLLIFRAKRLLNAAERDKYLGSFVVAAPEWAIIDQEIKNTTSEEIAQKIIALKDIMFSIHLELNWIQFLFSDLEKGDSRGYLAKLGSISREMLEDAKGKLFNVPEVIRESMIREIQVNLEIIEKAKEWRHREAFWNFRALMVLNSYTSYVTFPKTVCFDKE